MIYLNEDHLREIGVNWNKIITTIGQATHSLLRKDFAQPIKPYLRYRDLSNRIIAMPAFVGGDINFAGIKWIASFPKNLDINLKRANSITILNEPDTGVPKCIINTALISGIRTAGVTAFVLNQWMNNKRHKEKLKVGIAGFGPIGQLHLEMIHHFLEEKLEALFLYDIKEIEQSLIPITLADNTIICKNWEEAYQHADVFITCTVSDEPYINKPPKPGSLQLNVSLRDYVWEYRKYVDTILVDDWEEVCRENTDIEMMHKHLGLQKEDTYSITDLIDPNFFSNVKNQEVVMFNPMGMAVFDIAVAKHYLEQGLEKGVGIAL